MPNNPQKPMPLGPHGKVDKAVTSSVKAVKVLDQVATKIIGTQLLNYTPIRWISTTDQYRYTARETATPWVSNWDFIKAYTNISPNDAMLYANKNPNIKFFVYVNNGGHWDVFGVQKYPQYTAIFFGYNQPILDMPRPPYPRPGGLKNTMIYQKVDYINQHIVKAKIQSTHWRNATRGQLMHMLNDADRFGQEFEKRYQNLLNLSTRLSNGDRNANSAFKNELRALQNISRQAAQNAKNKEGSISKFLNDLATDARNFTSDQDQVQIKLAVIRNNINELKNQIKSVQSGLKKNFWTDLVPIMGLVDAIKGNSESLEHQLHQDQHKLNDARREEYHQQAISGRLNYLVQAVRVGQAGALALVDGWDNINASFNELIRAENIDTSMSAWIKTELAGAKKEWNDLRSLIRSIR